MNFRARAVKPFWRSASVQLQHRKASFKLPLTLHPSVQNLVDDPKSFVYRKKTPGPAFKISSKRRSSNTQRSGTLHHFLPIQHISLSCPRNVIRAIELINPDHLGYEGQEACKGITRRVVQDILEDCPGNLPSPEEWLQRVESYARAGKKEPERVGYDFPPPVRSFFQANGLLLGAEKFTLFFMAMKKRLEAVPVDIDKESYLFKGTAECLKDPAKVATEPLSDPLFENSVVLRELYGLEPDPNLDATLVLTLANALNEHHCTPQVLSIERQIARRFNPTLFKKLGDYRDLGMAINVQLASERYRGQRILWVVGGYHVFPVMRLVRQDYRDRAGLHAAINGAEKFDFEDIVKDGEVLDRHIEGPRKTQRTSTEWAQKPNKTAILKLHPELCPDVLERHLKISNDLGQGAMEKLKAESRRQKDRKKGMQKAKTKPKAPHWK